MGVEVRQPREDEGVHLQDFLRQKLAELDGIKFFQEDDFGERLRMFREAKGGGSVASLIVLTLSCFG